MTDKLSASRVGRVWHLWAHKYEDRYNPGGFTFHHVGAKWWVELHGLDEDSLVPVLVEEIVYDSDAGRYAPEVTNYGWDDRDDPPSSPPSMIQIRAGNDPDDPRRALMLLSMCFAYGLEAALEHGDGKVLALRITERTE